MSDTYFRATAEASAAFWAEIDAINNAYHAGCKAIEAEFPGYEPFQVTWPDGERYLIGLLGDACPGPLWVKLKDDDHWSPSRRSHAGKALSKRIRGVRMRMPNPPGFPTGLGKMDQPGGWRRVHFGYRYFSGILWVEADKPQAEIMDAPEYDASIWTPAPASSYYLAKEIDAATPARAGESEVSRG